VMALDAATPGRMAVTFYRELGGGEFLDRLESWHDRLMWPQRYTANIGFVGAPAPQDIARAAYGPNVDEKLRRACVERLLPCIVDGRALPRDLVLSVTGRASRRVGLEPHEWEKTLGIACALFKGYYSERNYQMSLEIDRTERDYLYGRLLAVAERTEAAALRLAGEKRDTMAARLMHRFSDHPYSTWRTIEIGLQPYKSRLRTNLPAVLNWLERHSDEIYALFKTSEFTDDGKLSGEFLLGYHCQRAKFFEPKSTDTDGEESLVEEPTE
jgi:CRISPR-associated protein Csd1